VAGALIRMKPAHRLHTAHDADRVVVLEEGRITEAGPHRDLIKAGGSYSALWESWHGGAAVAASESARMAQDSSQAR
jgi:hypothetical protein